MNLSTKIINKFKLYTNYKRISIIFLILISCLYLFGAVLVQTNPHGESNDFMMATLSLENRFSLFVTEEDIKQAKEDYPEHYDYLFNSYYELSNTSNSIGPDLANRLRLLGLPTDSEEAQKIDPVKYNEALNMRHCYYFSFYSLLCIPVHFLLKTLDLSRLSPSYSFAITNALIYAAALFTVFLKLKQSDKKKFFLILLLAINPAIFYIVWPSYEVCIFSFIIISLTFFTNREYKKSALFLSLVGMMQPTIMIFGLVIIVSFFITIWIRENYNNLKSFMRAIYKNCLSIMVLALCFLPSIIPFIYYKIQFNVWGLNLNEASTSLLFQRSLSYLFDLNYGVLPYCGIILILAIFMFAVGIIKRNKYSLAYFVIIFGILLGFSLMRNINSGMAGIARYNVFEIAFIVFYVVNNYDKVFTNRYIIRFFDFGIGLSALLTCLVVFNFGLFDCNVSDQSMTPIAQSILDNCPQLYNPLYSTFISRTNHIGGGYTYEMPVVYTTEEGYVRKALVTKDTADQLLTLLYGDESQMQLLKTKIQALNFSSEFEYINFGNDCSLVVKDKYGIVVEDNYAVDISSQEDHIISSIGQKITININLKNNTQNVFSSTINCFLSYHILDSNGNVVEYDGIRTELKSLYPDEAQAQDMTIEIPDAAGEYTLVIDIVREGVLWFSDKNFEPLSIELEVLK